MYVPPVVNPSFDSCSCRSNIFHSLSCLYFLFYQEIEAPYSVFHCRAIDNQAVRSYHGPSGFHGQDFQPCSDLLSSVLSVLPSRSSSDMDFCHFSHSFWDRRIPGLYTRGESPFVWHCSGWWTHQCWSVNGRQQPTTESGIPPEHNPRHAELLPKY
jgi:hypothetical protein